MEAADVIRVLRAAFPDAEFEIDRDATTGKIGGRMVSAAFAGRSFLQRQNRIHNLLRREFGPEAQELSLIFTYTPQEYAALEAV
jgi:stress-induced morphogen